MLKKTVVFLLSVIMLISFMTGTAFASSKLNGTINSLLGTPYKWAGTNERGFDCSGFTSYVFDQFGVDLPHNSKAQSREGDPVSKKNLRPGDLVFFNTGGSGISHVGIYVGNGKFAHAADDGVTISSLDERYYKNRYVMASRVLSDNLYEKITGEQAE